MEQFDTFWIEKIGEIGYGLAAIAFFLLTVLLITNWRGRLQGGLLLAACVGSTLWAAVLTFGFVLERQLTIEIYIAELVRDGLWLTFCVRLVSPLFGKSKRGSAGRNTQLGKYLLVGGGSFLVVVYFVEWQWGSVVAQWFNYDPKLLGNLILAILGLVLIEHIFRNTHPNQRWAIKYLCFGLGVMFVYDFYLYSNSFLVGQIDPYLWAARGFIQLLTVPLIAVAAARNPQWSLDVFVSREIIFHTASVLAAGSYLLLMAAGGYLIHYWGKEWGGIAQTVFLFGAFMVLVVLLFSGQARAHLKVFLNKHFFNYKYDYRDEWLKLTQALSEETTASVLRKRVVQVIGNMVDSPGGVLWLREKETNEYKLASEWNMSCSTFTISANDPLIEFIVKKEWLIDINEYVTTPEVYGDFELSGWAEKIPRAWLFVPLFQNSELYGLVLLTRSRAPRPINWEDRDLLKTAARQAASYLALAEASSELVNARQFEAFNRLSAYLVHDLKNVVGQLSLVSANAKKYADNKEFMVDAMLTVENAVSKMQKMLAQLRQGRPAQQSSKAIKLLPILREVVRSRSSTKPVPALSGNSEDVRIVAEQGRLGAVIEHIVQNAQEATKDTGKVEIRLLANDSIVVIEVEDDGCGMDSDFIRERLFKPFDTTKGNAGMGIGAYECREFIRALGGEVKVSSQIGKGSLFQLIVPQKNSDQD